jgi:hypothetical protein
MLTILINGQELDNKMDYTMSLSIFAGCEDTTEVRWLLAGLVRNVMRRKKSHSKLIELLYENQINLSAEPFSTSDLQNQNIRTS